MYLSRVESENIRCFRSGALKVNLDLRRPDGRHAGWTVLAGRNGAGKSTLLKAIAFAATGPDVSRALQQTFAGWLREGHTRGFAKVEVIRDPERDRFSRETKLFDRAPVLEWGLVQSSEGMEPDSTFGGPSGVLDTSSARLILDGPWALNPQGWFIAGYGPYRRLASSYETPRGPILPTQFNRLASLFREDVSLVESIHWLREHHLRRLEKKTGAEELVESVIALLNDGLLPESTRITNIDSEGLWVTQGKLNFPLNAMSDGYRTIAAFVLDLARQLQLTYQEFKLVQQNGTWCVPYPGVVLIDEVELHLHVSWQRNIGFWLKRHFPNIQFIVTTHSPFVCQAADPKGLIRLPAPGEERTAEHVSDDLFRTVVNGTVDEAVLTELFGLEHVHSEESEKLRTRVAELEVRLMNGKATEEERTEFERLSAQLPDTGSALVDRAVRNLGLDK
ncbi:AAA family ATPase [Pyxidicoccus fallax]|uniref:ATP-binding protein n=1 Tax=Pyxidicoccus fallax TaxID=394095 RepID=A0A848LKH4_9BACT|nr:ATP-binding protein [Pyxidicoccus fallax]NMO18218.1 ATP-binding protein [Pyxidicoccus fallax]NPC80156.1 AAA family ATPase [Pyxidicoccus fallax]